MDVNETSCPRNFRTGSRSRFVEKVSRITRTGRRGQPAREYWRPAPAAFVPSSLLFRSPAFEICYCFFLGYAFCVKNLLPACGGFLEGSSFGFTALAPGGNKIAHRVAVAGDRQWRICFKQVCRELIAELSHADFLGFHCRSLRTVAYTGVPLFRGFRGPGTFTKADSRDLKPNRKTKTNQTGTGTEQKAPGRYGIRGHDTLEICRQEICRQTGLELWRKFVHQDNKIPLTLESRTGQKFRLPLREVRRALISPVGEVLFCFS